MYLKQLYHYNKIWCAAFIFFIAAFIYLNVKWGLVATPVYQYGMFSGKYSVQDTQKVWLLYTDNGQSRLNIERRHFSDRDMIFSMIENYEQQQTKNLHLYQTLDNQYARIGLKNLVKRDNYQNNINDTIFSAWLRYFVAGGKVKRPFTDIQYIQQSYQWQQGKMQPLPAKP